MMDSDKVKRSSALEEMIATDGFQILRQEIEDRIREGWEDFIALSPDRKTCKVAYYHQANYKALKSILEWLDEELEEGRQVKKRFTSQLEKAGVKT